MDSLSALVHQGLSEESDSRSAFRAVRDRLGRLRPYLVAVLLVLLAKAPTLNNGILNMDEVLYLLEGQGLTSLEHFVFSFKYNPEYKLPLGLLPFMAAATISYDQAFLVLHLFGFAVVIVSALLMVRLSITAFDSPLPGIGAVALWLSYLNWDGAAAAPLLEYYQLPFLLIATLLFLRAERGNGGMGLLVWCGLSVGVAGLVKPPGLVAAPVLSALILLRWTGPRQTRLSRAMVLCSGAAAPVALFLLPYAINAEAREAITSLTGPVASYLSMVPLDVKLFRFVMHAPVGLLLPAVVATITTFRPHVRSLRWGSGSLKAGEAGEAAQFASPVVAQPRHPRWVVFWMGYGLLAGYFTGAGFAQHLVPVLPFLWLFAAHWFLQAYRGLPERWLRVTFASILLILALLPELPRAYYYAGLWADSESAYRSQMLSVDARDLISYVEANTDPDERIWVYAHAPEVYWFSRRSMAIDDPWGYIMAVYNPERVRDSLLRDRPAVVIDIHEPRLLPAELKVLLKDIPLIDEVLRTAYACSDAEVPGATVCKRNDLVSGRDR